jgi:hypothetical protein
MTEVRMMKTINMSSSDYHISMLTDLTVQNGGALILLYDSGKKVDDTHADGSISIVGKPLRVLSLATNIVREVSQKTGLDIDTMLEAMGQVIKEREEQGYDEP